MPAAQAAAETPATEGAEVLVVVVASPIGLAESGTMDAGGASTAGRFRSPFTKSPIVSPTAPRGTAPGKSPPPTVLGWASAEEQPVAATAAGIIVD